METPCERSPWGDGESFAGEMSLFTDASMRHNPGP